MSNSVISPVASVIALHGSCPNLAIDALIELTPEPSAWPINYWREFLYNAQESLSYVREGSETRLEKVGWTVNMSGLSEKVDWLNFMDFMHSLPS